MSTYSPSYLFIILFIYLYVILYLLYHLFMYLSICLPVYTHTFCYMQHIYLSIHYIFVRVIIQLSVTHRSGSVEREVHQMGLRQGKTLPDGEALVAVYVEGVGLDAEIMV